MLRSVGASPLSRYSRLPQRKGGASLSTCLPSIRHGGWRFDGQCVRRAAQARVTLTGPPAEYRLRDVAYAQSHAVVSQEFPELVDLVENGSLVIYERKSDSADCRLNSCYQVPERIFIVGTCHVSATSAAAVLRVMTAVRPDNVVVEVCKSRIAVLYEAQHSDLVSKASNPYVLSGKSFMETAMRSIELGGPFALGLRIIMGIVYRRLGRSLDVQSGVDMRAARQCADEMDINIILGDRPIEITLKRAMDALSLPRRLELFRGLLYAVRLPESDVQSEAAKMRRQYDSFDGEDVLSESMNQVAKHFPELASPLIHERDLYLAWSMKRSKAVDGAKDVVGVVGKGHLKGVYYALHQDTGKLTFKDLVGEHRPFSPSQRWMSLSKRLAFEVMLCVVGYYAWTAFSENAFPM